jgi:transposase
MMGIHQPQDQLFSYSVNLDHRIRKDHPLRRAASALDFTFVRAEVARCYGRNGNEGVDPVILAKLMFLLFFDDVPSERELMERLPERLDYLWFLGYNLDEQTPNHSVLSKARRRWGTEVFRNIFLRTVQQCVEAELVDGKKLHMDSSLVQANASQDSVRRSSPELIAAYKKAVATQESKLEESVTPSNSLLVNDTHTSTTDPDAALVSRQGKGSWLAYHHHRAVDDAHGVITAVETTPGNIPENQKLVDLVEQHEGNTRQKVETVVADTKYGTAENFVACLEKNVRPHLGLSAKSQQYSARRHCFGLEDFTYDAASDTYRCPAGQTLTRQRYHERRHTYEYTAGSGICGACPLRAQCTTGKERTVQRHKDAARVELGQRIARSFAARRDLQRRRHLMEGSFAQAANEHGFKRSRWRRLWRQQIQDWLIAAVQNIKILLRAGTKPVESTAMAIFATIEGVSAVLAQMRTLYRAWLIIDHAARHR